MEQKVNPLGVFQSSRCSKLPRFPNNRIHRQTLSSVFPTSLRELSWEAAVTWRGQLFGIGPDRCAGPVCKDACSSNTSRMKTRRECLRAEHLALKHTLVFVTPDILGSKRRTSHARIFFNARLSVLTVGYCLYLESVDAQFCSPAWLCQSAGPV
jgi:hypothetical protein